MDTKKIIFLIVIGIVSIFVGSYIFRFVLAFFLSLLLNSMNNAKYGDLRKTAELNARDYIQNKYHIEAKVLENKIENQCSPFCKITEKSILKMRYGKKEFYVYTNNNKRTTSGYDNYQFDQIQKKLINLLNKETGFKPYKYRVSYGKYVRSYDVVGLVDIYYDKTNIEELIKNYYIRIDSSYIGKVDFNKINYDNIYNIYGNNATIHLINYKNIKSYEKVINSEKYRLNNKIVGYDNLVYFAPYIEKVYIIEGKKIIKNDYSKIVKVDNLNFLLLTRHNDLNYDELSSLKINVNKTDYKWETLYDDYSSFSKNLIIDNYLINMDDNIIENNRNSVYLFVKKDKVEKNSNKYEALDFLYNSGFKDDKERIYYSGLFYEDYYVFSVKIDKVADKKVIVSLYNPF